MLHVDPRTPLAQVRPDIAGPRCAVVSDHPVATAAGAAVLARGGNAVDAAITMAAVLTVVRPHMCGLGGDAFALIRDGRTGETHALNGSGAAGSRASAAALRAQGHHAVPVYGDAAVTVPGAVRAWSDALERFGTISFSDALEPAAAYAADGIAVSTRLMLDLEEEHDRLAADAELAVTFLPHGDVPHAGQRLRQPALARSLALLQHDGAAAFYAGALGDAIVRHLARDGAITAGDLAQHRSEWTAPLALPFGGLRVLTAPPNSQGLALLLQLHIAEAAGIAALVDDPEAYLATLVGGARLAMGARDGAVADPRHHAVAVDEILSTDFARACAKRVREPRPPRRRGDAGGRAAGADTVHLAVVDGDGNAVSLIQSIFHSFGTGRMVPGTGIVLHNRGAAFSLDPASHRCLAPGVRPYHTLVPAMATDADGALRFVFGTPGGDAQTQTLTQVLLNRVVRGMSPQGALDAPRWRLYGERLLAVEEKIAVGPRARLHAAGYRVAVRPRSGEFGGAQLIEVDADGLRHAAADGRREAYAVAW